MAENTAVFGIFHRTTDSQSAIERLLNFGFTRDSISVLLPGGESSRELAHEKNTKAPEGTTTGVITGGVIGGAIAGLLGAGVLVLPGLGPLLAAGPVVAALAGLGAGGTVGGVVGCVVGMGIPEYEAKRYEGHVREGGVLLSVHCANTDEVHRAKDLLRLTGAEHISAAGEAKADYPARHPIAVHQ